MLARNAISGLLALVSLSMVSAAAQGQIGQCKSSDCSSDCPTYLSLGGDGGITDYPLCAIYDGGFPDYPRDDSGAAIVYHDVSQPEQDCAFILLSPANVDEPNCGTPIGQFRNAVCTRNLLRDTYMWQYCCGQACTDAGVTRRNQIRGANWYGQRSPLEGSLRTLSVHKRDGTPVEMHSHRPAMIKRENLIKRDCSGFTEERRYSTSGQTVLFGGTVQGPGSFEKSSETSVSRTTSVSATVGDPFGIVSTTVGFETTESASQSLTYTLELKDGELGTASWTPTLECIEGTFTGCGDEGDQKGNVCTPAVSSSGEVAGLYRIVFQS